jgi:hypothetical protein
VAAGFGAHAAAAGLDADAAFTVSYGGHLRGGLLVGETALVNGATGYLARRVFCWLTRWGRHASSLAAIGGPTAWSRWR